jgi:hypothetical protein
VIEVWEEPKHEEFAARTAWSLFNAFTEVQKDAGPRVQMESTLKLSALFRRDCNSRSSFSGPFSHGRPHFSSVWLRDAGSLSADR